jgi:hypothetical protein
MGLQERGYMDMDPALIAAMRQGWGLPPETLGILDTVDLQSGKNDAFLLGALESDAVDIQKKVKIIHRLHEAIFEDDYINQYDQTALVGSYKQLLRYTKIKMRQINCNKNYTIELRLAFWKMLQKKVVHIGGLQIIQKLRSMHTVCFKL